MNIAEVDKLILLQVQVVVAAVASFFSVAMHKILNLECYYFNIVSIIDVFILIVNI